MTTMHEQYYWFAGDDWQINATLLDESGAPFDLSAAPEIKYALINEAGARVLSESDAEISVIDGPSGQCAIKLPKTATASLPTGRYSDRIGIVELGIASTLAAGLDWVTGAPT